MGMGRNAIHRAAAPAAAFALVGVLVLSACDADNTYWSAEFNSTTGGKVHVVVTDSPLAELGAFHLTILEVSLFSEESPSSKAYASRGGHRVDLYSLRRTEEGRRFDVVTWDSSVRSGTYDGVRVVARHPEIRLASGETIPARDIAQGGSDTVEVRFEKPLRLEPDGELYLVLDFDLERSLEAPRGSGALGGWSFRPVVLADASPAPPAELLESTILVEGVVEESGARDGVLDLAIRDGGGHAGVGIEVASVLDADGGALPAGSLEVGASGRVHARLSEEGDLTARSVVLGGTP